MEIESAFLTRETEHLSGAVDGPVVRWCQPGVKSRWGWSGGAEERAVHEKTQGAKASWRPADCFYSFLGSVTLTSEEGLILGERSATHPISKREREWNLNPLYTVRVFKM